ncbi:MAG: monovalent cation/H+ antiporter complex subunit F [Oscillospiraceae bacterium]|nr:monovalent cation/H+ antiporter complex subunit F [Oscillospiraceae bacterium]
MDLLWIVLWIMLACSFIYLWLIIRGPSIWDRLLGKNLIATKIIVMILIFASINDSAFLLDFAIIYTLSGFIGIIFIALFLAERKKRRNP